jgi:hypothetical protein
MSSRREPDIKTDWLTDRQSQLNFNFNNLQLSKENFKEKEKLVIGPDGGLIPGQTG